MRRERSVDACIDSIRLHLRTCAILMLAAFVVAGCGGEQRAQPVDVSLARTTLTGVLEHWVQGGAIEELRHQTPEIVVQEDFWLGGCQLQEFQLGQGRAENANWFCDVELIMKIDGQGQPVRKKVTYAVGTDPVLTVFRAMI